MITAETIKTIVETKIKGSDYFITEVSVKPHNHIQVAIDRLNDKITINDCVEISRFIESHFNREEEDFQLDVLSAGLDEPFKVLQQYQKSVGKNVEVLTFDGIKQQVKLMAVNEHELQVQKTYRDKKQKKEITETLNIPFEKIKHTKKVISFK
jgi:ribosome maturation factor RimP